MSSKHMYKKYFLYKIQQLNEGENYKTRQCDNEEVRNNVESTNLAVT